LFVKGFIVDSVRQTAPPAANGAIPPQWFDLGRWEDLKGSRSPEEFWRTLVADRDPDGLSTHPYYPWALEHVVHQSEEGKAINTSLIIQRVGNSTIAEFLKRVQAVTWNRRLFRTAREDSLGLAPDAAREGDGESQSLLTSIAASESY
jgi:hypothetical protein